MNKNQERTHEGSWNQLFAKFDAEIHEMISKTQRKPRTFRIDLSRMWEYQDHLCDASKLVR